MEIGFKQVPYFRNEEFFKVDETSIGKLYDLAMLSEICQKHDLIFVIDAISFFLAYELDMDKYGLCGIIKFTKSIGYTLAKWFLSFETFNFKTRD